MLAEGLRQAIESMTELVDLVRYQQRDHADDKADDEWGVLHLSEALVEPDATSRVARASGADGNPDQFVRPGIGSGDLARGDIEVDRLILGGNLVGLPDRGDG